MAAAPLDSACAVDEMAGLQLVLLCLTRSGQQALLAASPSTVDAGSWAPLALVQVEGGPPQAGGERAEHDRAVA